MFLPDTNVWIELIKGRNTVIANRWRGVAAEDVSLCSIVKAELWHGACKYQCPEPRRAIVDEWIAPYFSIPFDDAAARCYADIRHHLESKGKIIGPNDLKNRRHLSGPRPYTGERKHRGVPPCARPEG